MRPTRWNSTPALKSVKESFGLRATSSITIAMLRSVFSLARLVGSR